MTSLTEAIQALRLGVDFANTDGTLANIRWDTPGVVPPTQEEVDAAMAVIEYREKRRSEYPPLTDLADAIVKQPTDDGAALDTYRAACLAVKAKYPKTEK
jgi:hypothetical protein